MRAQQGRSPRLAPKGGTKPSSARCATRGGANGYKRCGWSAVTRLSREGEVIGPSECIDRWDALKAITIGAAWQHREEGQKGTIATGKLADLVVLDGNPLTVDAGKLVDIRVLETFKEGKSVFSASGAGAAKAAPKPERSGAVAPPSTR